MLNRYKMKYIKNVDFHSEIAKGGLLSKGPFDKIESPISEPKKWEKELPEGALEFIVYTVGGQL